METVRKTTVASEPTINETIEEIEIKEETTVAPVELAPQETPLPQTTTPTTEPKQNIFDEAPTLYGNNPTAQEIEQFRQREQVWRQKLAANLK